MSEPNVRIYVVTHKGDNDLLALKDFPIYVPIYCGRPIGGDNGFNGEYVPELSDDTGDNISEKNRRYCELTGLYWIWKNDDSKPDDIVGLNHYRRYFREYGPLEEEQKLLTKETIIKKLEELDFITNGSNTDPVREDLENSVYNCYKNAHNVEDMDHSLDGIKLLFPELYPKMLHEIKSTGAMCPCNIFITRKKYLDDYCSFLFPLFDYVESVTDLKDGKHDGYQERYLGFLAERLMRAWLVARGYVGRAGNCLDWMKFLGKEVESK